MLLQSFLRILIWKYPEIYLHPDGYTAYITSYMDDVMSSAPTLRLAVAQIVIFFMEARYLGMIFKPSKTI